MCSAYMQACRLMLLTNATTEACIVGVMEARLDKMADIKK